MGPEYKTEEEIINFFRDRAGSREVFSICQILIPKSNVQDAEINHIRKILHKLKAEGYLLVQNEGENIFEEKFSSTPDRIDKYYEIKSKEKNFFNNKNSDQSGEVSFDYSNNNGIYYIGESERYPFLKTAILSSINQLTEQLCQRKATASRKKSKTKSLLKLNTKASVSLTQVNATA